MTPAALRAIAQLQSEYPHADMCPSAEEMMALYQQMGTVLTEKEAIAKGYKYNNMRFLIVSADGTHYRIPRNRPSPNVSAVMHSWQSLQAIASRYVAA